MYMRGEIKNDVSVMIKHSYWVGESSGGIIEQGCLCPLFIFLSDNSTTFYEYLEVHLCNKFMSQLFFKYLERTIKLVYVCAHGTLSFQCVMHKAPCHETLEKLVYHGMPFAAITPQWRKAEKIVDV